MEGGIHMRNKRILIAVMFSMYFLNAATLFAVESVPLPQDLDIVPPDKNTVPEKLAEFSGIWEGNWSHGYSKSIQFATIAVENITKDNADIVYGWGLLKFARKFVSTQDPGWKRYPGRPVEKASDGSYVITVKRSGQDIILKQTDKKDIISVTLRTKASGDMISPFYRNK